MGLEMAVEAVQKIMGFITTSKKLHFCWVISSFLLLLRSSALNSDGVLLLSLKYSVLSDPLSVLESWNYDDESPCLWTGITCAQIGSPGSADTFRVISLVLPSSQLLGSIPPNLGMIQHLRHLDLSDNFFNGSLPNSLFNASELQVLSLSNNVISGELPEVIGGLSSLSFLNLSDNALAGKVPKNMTALQNLTVISLRSNYFSGIFPSGFNSVEVLDLSSNLFNGSLPVDFGGETLRYLNLSSNRLFGEIPPEFVKRIPANATIDLSFNNLTGAIPESEALRNQKTQAFAGNVDLCGKPLRNLCSIPSTPSIAPNDSTTSSSSPAIAAIPKTLDPTPSMSSPGAPVDHAQQQSQSGLKPGTIAAIAVGDLAGIGILAVIFLYIYQLQKKKRSASTKSNSEQNQQKGSSKQDPPPHSDPRGLAPPWSCLTNNIEGETSEATCSDSDNGDGKEMAAAAGVYANGNEIGKNKKEGSLVMVDGEMKLELETLLKASAYVLGASSGSIVYKAVLEDGTALAVRRIGECGVERLKEFESQVRLIAKLRHPNLVRVRGFYWKADEKLIISDYVSNGCLASASTRKAGGSSPYSLPLEVRLKIARGVAQGLAYIHEKKHVHGNLKPTNILLTPNMEPVIGDFGLDRVFLGNNKYRTNDQSARHLGSSRSTASRDHDVQSPSVNITGSMSSPYQSPESLKNLKPNSKWDVYSFGIVLLELLTGRIFLDRELTEWSTGSVADEKNRVVMLVDVAIRGEVVGGKEDAMVACFRLGFGCASLAPQKRPSMKEAVQVLERVTSW